MRRHSQSVWMILAALGCALAMTGGRVAAGEVPSQDDRQVQTTIFLHPPPSAGQGEEAEEKKKEEEEKPFEEVVKDMETIEGLFTFYRKADENKVLLELRPDQFDQDYIYSPKFEQGTGERGLYGTILMWGQESIVQWRRLGKRVQFVHKNTRFRARPGSPVERAVEKSFSDSVVASAKILSQPHPERESVLVDLREIFLAGDLHGIAQRLKGTYKTGYKFDKDNSGFVLVKSFPLNSEIGTVVHFQAKEVKEPSVTLLDARSLSLRFRYSLVALPENDYQPRLGDDRVGHFLTTYQDLSSQVAEVPYVRLVERWNLKKKNPKAAVSEPVEPIVYWLENSIPVEYRDAIREGILLWNRAFEKAGFKNAIVVRQQPDDADWDPADIRYNTVRWFLAYDATFAIGPWHTNPYTGEILDADIGISDGIIRFPRAHYREFVNPAQRWEDVAAWIGEGPPTDAWVGDPNRLCRFGQEGAHQAALGYDVLQARGEMTPEREEKYIRQWILELMAHEVGHTLGLRHNFRASSINRVEQLHDRGRTDQVGIGASVMDYNPVNIAPQGAAQGDYFMPNLGSYDYWAIEYAYTPIPGAKTSEAELPELRQVAARAADPLLPYNSDEDAWFGPRSLDPLTSPWDLASDNLGYFSRQFGLVQDLFAHMEEKLEKPGESYEILRRSFNRMQRQYLIAGLGASKYIGGIYHTRDHVGDPNGRLPFVPVPPAEQRQALAFLADQLWASEAFQVPAQLLNKLALKRFGDFDFNNALTPRIDYPLHTVALNVQQAPLLRLYHPIALSRLQDLEVKYPDPNDRFTLADMFVGIRNAIWSELESGSSSNSFRRNLQRAHLKQLIQMILKPQEGTPEDAVTLARADLVELQGRIEQALGRGSLDYTNRAHLEETQARIRQALEAQLQRGL